MKTLLKKLVRADSTVEKGELAAAHIIAGEFARFGIRAGVQRWGKNRANVIATVNSSGQEGALLFVCHLDVVPSGSAKWKYPPFGAVEEKGRIWGRGTTDMKGGMSAAVASICEIVRQKARLRGDIIFFATAGEETDSCGVTRLLARKNTLPPLTGIIVPEPTDLKVVTMHRGLLWLKVTTRGKAAHGSTPQLGINAVSLMKLFMDRLQRHKIPVKPHKLLGECTVSVNTISGGEAINIIPDRCSIGIDIRTLPGQDNSSIIKYMQNILTDIKRGNPGFEAEIAAVRDSAALNTDKNCKFVKDVCSVAGAAGTGAIGFTTDGPYFAGTGAPIVVLGPGESGLCHKPDEYIRIKDLEKAARCYEKIILKVLT